MGKQKKKKKGTVEKVKIDRYKKKKKSKATSQK